MRLVDDRRIDADDPGQRRRQLPALERGADPALPGVLASGVHGLRDPAGHVLDHPHHGVGHLRLPGSAEQQYALVGIAGDEWEGERRPARMGDAGTLRPRPGRTPDADRGGRRNPLQFLAQRGDALLVGMPDPGQLQASPRHAQPDAAPVREPGYEHLGRERRDHGLVELACQEFAGLGEERRAATVAPLGGVPLGMRRMY